MRTTGRRQSSVVVIVVVDIVVGKRLPSASGHDSELLAVVL